MNNCFYIGCNYWASNSGTNMWKDFDIEIIKKDMHLMNSAGIDTIRVFPLWSDFQPIIPIYSQEGVLNEVRMNGFNKLTDGGIDPVMLERFKILLDIAEVEGISVIVGLITGWMSGRLFIPLPLYNKNIIKDPLALMWQSRFVRAFVKYFKDNKNIICWDLGNEGNCMAAINDNSDAYLWTATISGAIKREDNERPIISGMHSLDANPNGKWTIKVQGELCDIMSTHPYDYWVPYCLMDSLSSMRAIMHSSGESLLYSALSGKPCLVEEIGTMGPMIADNKVSACFMRATLYNNFANGHLGQLWWCAFDHSNLDFPPYDYMGCERELGLFNTDYTAKPMTEEILRFKNELKAIGISSLPKITKQALVILTYDQDCWAAAYGSYLLAKQAGFEIDYAFATDDIKDYGIYILPSVKENRVLPKKTYNELLNKVKNGATLLITMDDCFLEPFESVTGIRVHNFYMGNNEDAIKLNNDLITYKENKKYVMTPTTAKVIASDSKNDVFFINNYGKGKVYTLTFPLENYVAVTPVIASSEEDKHYRIYEEVVKDKIYEIFNKNIKLIAKTEHYESENAAFIQLINCSNNTVSLPLEFNYNYFLDKVLIGKAENNNIILDKFDVALLKVIRNK